MTQKWRHEPVWQHCIYGQPRTSPSEFLELRRNAVIPLHLFVRLCSVPACVCATPGSGDGG